MWNKIWRWLYKQRWIFFMLALVGVTVFFGFKNSDFRSAFLFDRYGQFQWVSVTASFGGIGLFINANAKKQEIRANILSKNELDVLANFRVDCAELSVLIWKYNNKMDGIIDLFKMPTFFLSVKSIDQRASNIIRESANLNTIYHDIKQKYNLVRLDSASHTNLNFFRKDLEKLMSELEDALDDLQEDNYKNGQSNEHYDLIVAANNQFIKSSSEYISVIAEEQKNKIS